MSLVDVNAPSVISANPQCFGWPAIGPVQRLEEQPSLFRSTDSNATSSSRFHFERSCSAPELGSSSLLPSHPRSAEFPHEGEDYADQPTTSLFERSAEIVKEEALEEEQCKSESKPTPLDENLVADGAQHLDSITHSVNSNSIPSKAMPLFVRSKSFPLTSTTTHEQRLDTDATKDASGGNPQALLVSQAIDRGDRRQEDQREDECSGRLPVETAFDHHAPPFQVSVELTIGGEHFRFFKEWTFDDHFGDDKSSEADDYDDAESDNDDDDDDKTIDVACSTGGVSSQCFAFARRVAMEYGLDATQEIRVRQSVQEQVTSHLMRYAARRLGAQCDVYGVSLDLSSLALEVGAVAEHTQPTIGSSRKGGDGGESSDSDNLDQSGEVINDGDEQGRENDSDNCDSEVSDDDTGDEDEDDTDDDDGTYGSNAKKRRKKKKGRRRSGLGAGKRLPASATGSAHSRKNDNTEARDRKGKEKLAGVEKAATGRGKKAKKAGEENPAENMKGPGEVADVWVENIPEDHNTDVCGICSRGGDLLCCDRCPRAFHMNCLGVNEDDLPEGQWVCNGCVEDQHQFEHEALLLPPPKFRDSPTSNGVKCTNKRRGRTSVIVDVATSPGSDAGGGSDSHSDFESPQQPLPKLASISQAFGGRSEPSGEARPPQALFVMAGGATSEDEEDRVEGTRLLRRSVGLEKTSALVSLLLRHDFAAPFAHPLDPEAMGLIRYDDIVEYRMDLSTAKRRIQKAYAHAFAQKQAWEEQVREKQREQAAAAAAQRARAEEEALEKKRESEKALAAAMEQVPCVACTTKRHVKHTCAKGKWSHRQTSPKKHGVKEQAPAEAPLTTPPSPGKHGESLTHRESTNEVKGTDGQELGPVEEASITTSLTEAQKSSEGRDGDRENLDEKEEEEDESEEVSKHDGELNSSKKIAQTGPMRKKRKKKAKPKQASKAQRRVLNLKRRGGGHEHESGINSPHSPAPVSAEDEKLEDEAARTYGTVEALRDVRTVWHNCCVYNAEGSAVTRMAKHLSKMTEVFVSQHLSAMSCHLPSFSSEDPSSLVSKPEAQSQRIPLLTQAQVSSLRSQLAHFGIHANSVSKKWGKRSKGGDFFSRPLGDGTDDEKVAEEGTEDVRNKEGTGYATGEAANPENHGKRARQSRDNEHLKKLKGRRPRKAEVGEETNSVALAGPKPESDSSARTVSKAVSVSERGQSRCDAVEESKVSGDAEHSKGELTTATQPTMKAKKRNQAKAKIVVFSKDARSRKQSDLENGDDKDDEVCEAADEEEEVEEDDYHDDEQDDDDDFVSNATFKTSKKIGRPGGLRGKRSKGSSVQKDASAGDGGKARTGKVSRGSTGATREKMKTLDGDSGGGQTLPDVAASMADQGGGAGDRGTKDVGCPPKTRDGAVWAAMAAQVQVGHKFFKDFGRLGVFEGTVITLTWPYVTVRYDDGDVEDLEAPEFLATTDSSLQTLFRKQLDEQQRAKALNSPSSKKKPRS